MLLDIKEESSKEENEALNQEKRLKRDHFRLTAGLYPRRTWENQQQQHSTSQSLPMDARVVLRKSLLEEGSRHQGQAEQWTLRSDDWRADVWFGLESLGLGNPLDRVSAHMEASKNGHKVVPKQHNKRRPNYSEYRDRWCWWMCQGRQARSIALLHFIGLIQKLLRKSAQLSDGLRLCQLLSRVDR